MTSRGKGFIQEHDQEIRDNAIAEFVDTWQEYSSASAAAREIAAAHKVGRTTLTGWLEQEDKWPSATVHQLRRLQRENARLREENAELRKQLDEYHGNS
jgi:hypothetical protein